MKHTIIAISAVVLTACGAGDFETDDGSTGEMLELGTVKQPIWLNTGYGTDGNANRCQWDSTQNGDCNVPNNKTMTWVVQWDGGPCDWSGNEFWRDAMATATLEMVWVANANGWNVHYGGVVAHNSQAYAHSRVKCRINTNGGTSAYTSISKWFTQYHCNSVGGSSHDLCKYEQSNVYMHATEFVNLPEWSGWSTLQRGHMVKNAIRHEMAHVLGLGHNVNAGTCDLMRPQFQSWVSCWSDGARSLSWWEQTMLGNYVP